MFSSQIGSPANNRSPLRFSAHTPFTFRRHNGPLFAATPSSTPLATLSDQFPTPISTPQISGTTSTNLQPISASNAILAIQNNYIHLLRWDSDNLLHPIEFFIQKYGGSKFSPPPQWLTSRELLRLDATDGNAYNLFSFIDEYGGDQTNPPAQWFSAAAAPPPQSLDASHDSNVQMPWGDNIRAPSFLFRVAPPKLNYPTGSIDENVNAHFVRTALGYLRSSTFVRDAIDWDSRPHPFYYYAPLKEFASAHGRINFVFDNSKTLATLKWVQTISPDFERSLRLVYNFGGVLSYSNISERIYHVVYGWLNHSTVGGDVHLLAGIDASDGVFDGVTLLRVVLDSLQIVRNKDVTLQAQRFSKMISTSVFIMRPGGMQAYLGDVDQHRIALVNIKQPLSDAEILGRIITTLSGKHEQIDTTFREMRIAARKTGVETTFAAAKQQLIDCFRYDVPANVKTEKPPKLVPSNFTPTYGATNGDNHKRKPGGQQKRPFRKRQRPSFPKGSCPNCPDSTTHTSKFCFKEKRKEKGLSAGEIWCEAHSEGVHWDSECSRHPGNKNIFAKNRAKARVTLVEAAVARQISLMVSTTEDDSPNPPRTASLTTLSQDQSRPPPSDNAQKKFPTRRRSSRSSPD